MTAVWALDLPDSEKIVLLALADCANDEGHCWPSIRTLTVKCSKTDRTIQTAIKSLVVAGHLTRREVPGKGCNYSVHPRSDDAPVVISPPKGATQTPEAVSDKPSRTINSETKVSSQRVFDRYNLAAKKFGFVVCREFDAGLRQKMRLRLRDTGEAILIECIELMGKSPWLRGEGRETSWRPDLDWFLSPSKLRKIRNGAYGVDAKPAGDWSEERMAAYLAKANAPDALDVGSLAKKILGEVRSQ